MSISGHIPEPHQLFGAETRAAFYDLIDDVRRADTTERELILLMERFAEARREYQAFFIMIETEFLRKMRDFRETADRERIDTKEAGH